MLPTLTTDPSAWPYFLESQHIILLCTQFTVSLKKALENGSNLTPINQRMAYLDEQIDTIVTTYSEQVAPSQAEYSHYDETPLAESLRLQAQIKLNSARIKLHRYKAFLDIPIFSKRHCDLTRTDPNNHQTEALASCCGGHASTNSPPYHDQFYHTSFPTPLSYSSPSTATTSSSPDSTTSFTQPFSDPKSAKKCLKAALAISQAFEALPYPRLPTRFLSATSTTQAPRTMPAFACCAMQSCYALLSLSYKSSLAPRSESVQRAQSELHAGIGRVLAALENYATAFEALGGMTGTSGKNYILCITNFTADQVREAWEGLDDINS